MDSTRVTVDSVECRRSASAGLQTQSSSGSGLPSGRRPRPSPISPLCSRELCDGTSVVSPSGAARFAVVDRPAYRFTHDDAGVTSSSTFGWLVSWGGFSTRVPADVTLCPVSYTHLRAHETDS